MFKDRPIVVPVGQICQGRIINCLGATLDKLSDTVYHSAYSVDHTSMFWSVYPVLSEMQTNSPFIKCLDTRRISGNLNSNPKRHNYDLTFASCSRIHNEFVKLFAIDISLVELVLVRQF